MISDVLGAIGRFAMIESVARQLQCSLTRAAELLEPHISPTDEISYQNMTRYVSAAVGAEQLRRLEAEMDNDDYS